MRTLIPCYLLVALLASCRESGTPPGVAPGIAPGVAPAAKKFVEGKDYVVLERVRFMDEQGFESPAEAFSVLLPKGWKHEGGVSWKGMQECRGEMVSATWSASSPDDAIRFVSLPLRTWGSASDPAMQQMMTAQAASGGCETGGVMSAEQYLRKIFGPRELQGASIVEVKANDAATREMDQHSQKTKAEIAKYGGRAEIKNSAVVARLQWSDGSEGIALISVANVINSLGSGNRFTSSMATERSFIRFPAARKDEAERFLTTVKSSVRTNPEWKRSVDGFFVRLRENQDAQHRQRMAAIDQQTRANTAAHNQRMNNIQAQGAANTAAHNQRMNNMDTQMQSWKSQQSSQDAQLRSWESQQSADDRMHKRFVQTIREVETYQDSSGTVELSSGYDQAWSRGDGTYILSNSPGFDPSSALQDQNWKEMKLTPP